MAKMLIIILSVCFANCLFTVTNISLHATQRGFFVFVVVLAICCRIAVAGGACVLILCIVYVHCTLHTCARSRISNTPIWNARRNANILPRNKMYSKLSVNSKSKHIPARKKSRYSFNCESECQKEKSNS